MRKADIHKTMTAAGAVEDAIRWVLESGIQEVCGEDAGAFWSWEDPNNPGFLYSEVTGYGISAFCLPLSWDERAMDRARLAADWLFERARTGRVYACRKVGGRFATHACTFDNGVILRGLCALCARTGERKYLDAVRALADWVVDEMQHPSGFLNTRMDLQAQVVLPFGDRWSSRPGAYQAKAAFALLHAARVACEARWTRAATRVCEWALREQGQDGRFVTDSASGGTYLHAHAYAVEGLAACGALLGRTDFLDAARRGLRWAVSLVEDWGRLPAHFDPNRGMGEEERSDAIAQVLRLVLCLEGPAPIADILAARLIAFQCRDADSRRYGGFFYSCGEDGFGLNITTHGTLFAIQALDLYARGARGFEWWDLV